MSIPCVCCSRIGWMHTAIEDVCHPCQYEAGIDYCIGLEGHDVEAKRIHCNAVWKKIIECLATDRLS